MATLTYLTLLFGELVPKRVALGNADRIAVSVAPLMSRLARIASPLVKVLTYSTEGVVRLARIRAPVEPPVTGDEINLMLC